MGELTPAQASALSLVLRHEQSYDDLGRRLGIDPMSVRARAHEGAAILAGLEPGAAEDGTLIDRALGQLPTWEAEALLVQLDDPDEARKLERLTESLEAFVGPRLRPVSTPAEDTPAKDAAAEEVSAEESFAEEELAEESFAEEELAATEPLAGVGVAQHSPVAGTAIVRRPRARRSPRRAVVLRMGAMLSLGLGSLAAGGILFIDGAH